MNGRKLYVRPVITANFDAMSWSLLVSPRNCRTSIRWLQLTKRTTGPPFDRMVCHASVRIRKLVKNGAITSTSRKFFHRPDLNAMA